MNSNIEKEATEPAVSSYDYDRDDPSFISDLRESKTSVAVVARWLSDQGYPVVIRPTFERPDVSRKSDFSDDGDLEIMHRVEVKRRVGLTFTSKEDFPYETLIVDACHCYDNARPKPYSYVILNRDMTAAFVINVKSTKKHWRRISKMDRFKKRDRTFYEVPVAMVRLEKIAQHQTES